ncbi:MAG: glycosyltransferase [Ekhidna sp.]|uniref:glycosyltransferase n=1 Tax=Ekhidna sp. TaxID=2608089 RepID=UPI0032EAFE45
MNVFIVPSWYPSASNPSYGIFIREQIGMMARLRSSWKIGVSTWGQGDHDKLLWVRDHVKNISKLSKHANDQAGVFENGFTEYYQPALSWTKKFRKGNLREIIRCNELNYQAHVLASGKPDVLMVQAAYPGVLIGAYLSEKYKVPVHLHVRLGGAMFEQMLSELGSLKKELLSALGKCDLVTATSDFHVSEIQKWVPHAQTLHNPVDTDFFALSKTCDDYFLSIGRLEPEKGFDMLLDAIKNLPDVNLKIAGSGSQSDELTKRIIREDLSNRVELAGERSREEVRNLMQECQFLVLPSKYETFGNVLLETMACGKPVVATACGGPQEIVSGKTGILTEVGVKSLEEGIVRMTKMHQDYDPVEIRDHVEKEFSPVKWMDWLEGMFRSIV